MTENDLLLPEGARLLHVGPPKTGTTAIQGALARSRRAMVEHGVVYPGTERQHYQAAAAAMRSRGRSGAPPVDRRAWDRLVHEVAAAGNRRVVVSAEAFASADEAAVRRIVDGLGGPRVHVVVTLRPLAKMMPSAWQQQVHVGRRTSYNKWLAGVLARAPQDGRPASSEHTFWQRHCHYRLVERWTSVVGPDHLTVVVLDESDRTMLTRTFEQLLGLPTGLLEYAKATNPSLTYGEVELVRHVNRQMFRQGWSKREQWAWIRRGVLRHLPGSTRAPAHTQPIVTPEWAAEPIAELGTTVARRVAAAGVRVVGDLATLGRPPVTPATDEASTTPADVVPAAALAQAVLGTILAATTEGSEASRYGVHAHRRVRHRAITAVRRRRRTPR